jgi:hypothetical protein
MFDSSAERPDGRLGAAAFLDAARPERLDAPPPPSVEALLAGGWGAPPAGRSRASWLLEQSMLPATPLPVAPARAWAPARPAAAAPAPPAAPVWPPPPPAAPHKPGCRCDECARVLAAARAALADSAPHAAAPPHGASGGAVLRRRHFPRGSVTWAHLSADDGLAESFGPKWRAAWKLNSRTQRRRARAARAARWCARRGAAQLQRSVARPG